MSIIYKPLDFARFETRLVNIQAGSEGDMVQCTLEHISLFEEPDYCALSYWWGDAADTRMAIVDDKEVSIRRELDHALRELRRRGICRLWVDAICINQHDNYEKEYQVHRMGPIYNEARRVYAWLGVPTPDSDAALDAICTARDNSGELLINPSALRSIFERPYWRRIWIIQELAKAQEVTFFCGDKTVEWNDLISFFLFPPIEDPWTHEQQEVVSCLDEFRDRESRGQQMRLSAAILRSRKSAATLNRDKLFALLGLARDGAFAVVVPNYLFDESIIYYRTMRSMIVGQQRTSPILLARRRSRDSQADLPS